MMFVARSLAASLAIAAALVAPTFVARDADGAKLSSTEKLRLARGEMLVEPTTLERDGHHFVGGVSYRIVDADWSRLSRILRDTRRYPELFPRTKSAVLERVDKAGRAHVRFTHGMGIFSGSYSAVLAFQDRGRYCWFHVDRGADNVIEDGWGFIRLTPLPGGRTLVTYGVVFDLGDSPLRGLFEAKIQRAALDFPRRLADAAART